jgi:hypothetical protein
VESGCAASKTGIPRFGCKQSGIAIGQTETPGGENSLKISGHALEEKKPGAQVLIPSFLERMLVSIRFSNL